MDMPMIPSAGSKSRYRDLYSHKPEEIDPRENMNYLKPRTTQAYKRVQELPSRVAKKLSSRAYKAPEQPQSCYGPWCGAQTAVEEKKEPSYQMPQYGLKQQMQSYGAPKNPYERPQLMP